MEFMMKQTYIALFFLFISSDSFGQGNVEKPYFVFPERSQWQHLKNPQERKSFLQIPEEFLSNILTDELLVVCLEYPYLQEMIKISGDWYLFHS